MTFKSNLRASASEHQIQKAICEYLHFALPEDAIFWAVPNGGSRQLKTLRNGKKISIEGARLKAEGVKAGVADLMILWAGRLICLEVKTDKGRPSRAQKDWEQACTSAGGLYQIVRSVDEVRSFLAMIGCERPKRLGAPNDIDDWLHSGSSNQAQAGHQGNKARAEYSGAK